MASGKMRFKLVGQSIAVLAMLAASLGAPSWAAAQDAASSPADRARFVSIARELEKAPLDPGLLDDRTWALQWLTEAPDITVSICAEPLGGVVGSGYPHSPAILVQYMYAMAARIIEHPEMADDKVAQQIAGVESALAAYRAILKTHPDDKSAELDGVLESKTRGELPAFVRQAYESCMAASGKGSAG